MFKQESSLILYDDLYGGRIIDYQLGTLTNVNFGFEKLWGRYQEMKSREGMPYMDVRDVHLMHVHPPDHLYYSEYDRQVMKGFALAFGDYLPFYTICFLNNDIYNIDCNIKQWIYNGKIIEQKLNQTNFIYDYKKELVILKLLSYGSFSNKDLDSILYVV